MRIHHRLQGPFLAAMPFLLAGLTAIGVVRGGPALLLVLALAGLAIVLVGFTLRPQDAFVVWLVVAPFLQNLGNARLGHLIRIVLFAVPPLVFVLWTLIQRRPVRGSAVDLLPASYAALVIVSAVVTGSTAPKTQIFTVVVVGVIVYYFCAFGSLGDDLFRRVAWAILVTGSISAAVVIVAKVGGLGFAFEPSGPRTYARATGLLGDSGYLGTFLGIGLVIAVSVLVWSGPSSLRRLSLWSLTMIAPALFLTLSRGPLIAAGSVGFILVVARSRSRWPTVVMCVLALVLGAAAWGTIASTGLYRDRFSNTSNIQGRVLIDRWSFILAGRKPLFGWGYGSFDRVKNSANLSSGSLPRSDGLDYTSHNTFLTVLVELGGLGLLLLVLPWIVIARSALRCARAPGPHRWAFVGLLAMLGVWVINAGAFDIRFFPFASALPWLAAGLLRRLTLDVEQSPVEVRALRGATAH